MSVCDVLGWRPVTTTWTSTRRCPVVTPAWGISTTNCSWRKFFVYIQLRRRSHGGEPSDAVLNHDETDITMMSYLLKAAESDTRVIAFSQMTPMCSWCLCTGCTETTFGPQCNWSGGMQPFGTSTPLVLSSAPSACRFWELYRKKLHTVYPMLYKPTLKNSKN